MYGEIHRYTLHCTSRHACIPGEHALIGACRSTASAISALLHYTQDGLSPDTPNRVSRGEYLHTHICMYGEIHHYAVSAHHDMHAFPGTHALVGGAEVLHTGSTYPLTPSTYSYGEVPVGPPRRDHPRDTASTQYWSDAILCTSEQCMRSRECMHVVMCM